MSQLDDAIQDALSKEDAEFLTTLAEEPGTFRQIAGIFQGPLNWIYVAFLIAAIVVGIFGVYAGWQFAVSTELRPLFYWGAVTGFCVVVLAVVRLLFFMQLHTNRILRELKRLELQVALLARANGRS
jgi:cytochrome b561